MAIFLSELHPSENRTENQLKIDWPENHEFFQQRDKYISDNLQAEMTALKAIPNFRHTNQEEIARLVCEAKFSFDLISKISPLKLNYPVNFRFKTNEVGEAEDDSVMSILPETNDDGTVLISFVLTLNLNEVVSQSIWYKDKTREADAQYLSSPVHEFAHMLYLQQAFGGNAEKMKELLIHNQDEEYTKGLSDVQLKNLELATDLEIRSRIWQVTFLEKYFKYLEITREVRTNLEQRRVLRRNIKEEPYFPK